MIESKMCVICGYTQPLDMETKIILGTALFSDFGIYIQVPVKLHNMAQAHCLKILSCHHYLHIAFKTSHFARDCAAQVLAGILFALVKIWMSWVARVRVRQTIFRVEIHSPG